MPDLYRVFPALLGAGVQEPGSALFVPGQGGGRIDNPNIYSVLYLGDSETGAIAEAFGRFPEWRPDMLEGSPSLPGSKHTIARYHLNDDSTVCNLDDPQRLLDLELRPSGVVSRDYNYARQWARKIHGQKQWTGVRWWSFYNPEWSSFALWDLTGLSMEELTPLRSDYSPLIEAARIIVRPLIKPKARPSRV